jgi:riboflavin synthase
MTNDEFYPYLCGYYSDKKSYKNMFTGIIEKLGQIEKVVQEGTNYHFTIAADMSKDLKIDQSVSHNGACLTVVDCDDRTHTVTAIKETLDRTSLGSWKVGEKVNLERAMKADARLDGHFVQGHVDTIGKCVEILEEDGSWYFKFEYEPTEEHLLVDKGSVSINGVSLTVVNPVDDYFSVAIIPYTYENTVFHQLKVGGVVNLEFDVIGKYIAKYVKLYMK